MRHSIEELVPWALLLRWDAGRGDINYVMAVRVIGGDSRDRPFVLPQSRRSKCQENKTETEQLSLSSQA